MLLETFMHKFLGGHIFISLGLDFHFCREKNRITNSGVTGPCWAASDITQC